MLDGSAETTKRPPATLRLISCAPKILSLLVVLAFILAACGETEEVGFDTATPGEPSNTSVATPTASPDPGGPTPAEAKAPDHCLGNEGAYVDPDSHFSFCYLNDMELLTTETNEGTAVTVRHPIDQDNRLVVTWAKAERQVGVVVSTPCVDSPHVIKNRMLKPFEIADATVEACFQDHFDAQNPEVLLHKTIELEIPTKDGAAIQVHIALGGPDFQRNGTSLNDLAERLTTSAVISQTDIKTPDNCLSGEKAYVDPDGHFAFCYPDDMELHTVETSDGVGVTAMHPLADEDRVVAHWSWVAQGRVGQVPGAPCRPHPTEVKSRTIKEIAVDDIAVQACFQDHFDRVDTKRFLYSTIEMELPATDGGVIQIWLAYTGTRNGVPTKDIALRILDSGVIGEVGAGD